MRYPQHPKTPQIKTTLILSTTLFLVAILSGCTESAKEPDFIPITPIALNYTASVPAPKSHSYPTTYYDPPVTASLTTTQTSASTWSSTTTETSTPSIMQTSTSTQQQTSAPQPAPNPPPEPKPTPDPVPEPVSDPKPKTFPRPVDHMETGPVASSMTVWDTEYQLQGVIEDNKSANQTLLKMKTDNRPYNQAVLEMGQQEETPGCCIWQLPTWLTTQMNFVYGDNPVAPNGNLTAFNASYELPEDKTLRVSLAWPEWIADNELTDRNFTQVQAYPYTIEVFNKDGSRHSDGVLFHLAPRLSDGLLVVIRSERSCALKLDPGACHSYKAPTWLHKGSETADWENRGYLPPLGFGWLRHFGDTYRDPVPTEIRDLHVQNGWASDGDLAVYKAASAPRISYEVGRELPPISAVREIAPSINEPRPTLFAGDNEIIFAGGVTPQQALAGLRALNSQSGSGCIARFWMSPVIVAWDDARNESATFQSFEIKVVSNSAETVTHWGWRSIRGSSGIRYDNRLTDKDGSVYEDRSDWKRRDPYYPTCETIRATPPPVVNAADHVSFVTTRPWYNDVSVYGFEFGYERVNGINGGIAPAYSTYGSTLANNCACPLGSRLGLQLASNGLWVDMTFKPGDLPKLDARS